MAAGDVTQRYRASVALDVTNLQSQPASASWITGWTSPAIDNSVDLDLDHLIAGQFTVAAASLTAGEIHVYVLPMRDDSNWPNVYSTGTPGTQSASAVLWDTTIRDGAMRRIWWQQTDTDNSRIYTMPQTSIKDVLGFMPRKYLLFVAHSTGQPLASSGNGFWVTGAYNNIAQS